MPCLPKLSLSLHRVAGCLLAAALLLGSAAAGTPPPEADVLLRQAVANENRTAHDGYYAWMDRLAKPRGATTKLMVATPQGILSRVVAYNDRDLTADERKQDDERIDRLRDPRNMHEKAGKQRDDQQRVERLLHALPDAFRCHYVDPPNAQELSMECAPAPGYSPPNYESQVLQGMKAVISIDREARRITHIQGTLFKDVNFGWGFVGRLNRGGKIEITQSKVAEGHWDITQMKLLFDGRVLLFKSLHIEESDRSWEYHSVPSMTVPQALDYLRSAK
jgi:hypothetical protein